MDDELEKLLSLRLPLRVCLALLFLTLAIFPSSWAPKYIVPLGSSADSKCVPLSSPRGHWERVFLNASAPIHATGRNGLWRADPKLSWVRKSPCNWTVSGPDAFFEQLDGKVLLIMGDSTVRNMVFNFVGAASNCCEWQLSTGAAVCDTAAVLDKASCAVLKLAFLRAWRRLAAERGPADPEWLLRRDDKTVVIRFNWVTHPRGIGAGWMGNFLDEILIGRDHTDAVLLAAGYWPIVGSVTAREGMESALDEWVGTLHYIANYVSQQPSLARKIVVRGVYTDEYDIPKPGSAVWPTAIRNITQNSDVPPDVFTEYNTRLGVIVRSYGFKYWDVSTYTDVRAGGIERKWNTPFLTYDGLHLQTQADIVLAWEWLSYVAQISGKK